MCKWWNPVQLVILVIMLGACAQYTPAIDTQSGLLNVPVYRDLNAYNTEMLLRAQGDRMVNASAQRVNLKGVAFGNEVWFNPSAPTEHHDERDFIPIKEMGLNCIRFYLSYRWFESDRHPYVYRQSGWDWLDRNLEWAEKHGIYLILNMHYPQGGYQSNGKGDALWDDPKMQLRLIRLWQAIAKRYRGHPNIAALDLVNEPIPTQSATQWQTLAKRLVTAIRVYDPEHMIAIERTHATRKSWDKDENQNFFRIDDPNILYEYHFYEPMAFSHQMAPWLQAYQSESIYPDPLRYEILGKASWYGATFNNPTLDYDSDEWKYIEGNVWWTNDPMVNALHPALMGQKVDDYVEFINIAVYEYAPNSSHGHLIRRIDLSDKQGWYFWSKDGSGDADYYSEDGRNIRRIRATDSDANWNSASQLIIPKPGYGYKISGWMRGRGLHNSHAMIRLDFLSGIDKTLSWDRQLLETKIEQIEAWSKREQVPVYMGEFGCIRACFEQQRGGLTWIKDILDILQQRGTSFTYHAYHENAFGIYYNERGLPDPASSNQALIQMFRARFAHE